MRHLSRENLTALVKVLALCVDTLLAYYGLALVFSNANMPDKEVEAIIIALRTALGWAQYMLEKSDD